MTARFELRRCSDDLVYRFTREMRAGKVAYRREDGPYWIERDPRMGWIAEGEAGAVAGRPWDVLPQDQGDAPPQGIWVSLKGAKSYVYELVHVS